LGFKKYILDDVGYVLIPNNMEMQTGAFRKGADRFFKEKFDIEPIANRVVFQPKGANQFDESALANYARVIIETYIGNYGDYENLVTNYTATKIELNEINNDFRKLNEEQIQKIGSKIIKWNSAKLVKINGVTALKLSYIRESVNSQNKPIVVEIYYHLQNNDRMHLLTVSYKQSEKNYGNLYFQKS
jgi:hypothetical protein